MVRYIKLKYLLTFIILLRKFDKIEFRLRNSSPAAVAPATSALRRSAIHTERFKYSSGIVLFAHGLHPQSTDIVPSVDE